MAAVGKTYVLLNADAMVPSVPQYLGTSGEASMAYASMPMAAYAAPALGEAAAMPAAYVGTYPMMANDHNIIMWANGCDSDASVAASRPW